MLNFHKPYPTEYNVYSGEGVFSSYRLAYGVAQKNYFIYNHLGSKAVEVDSAGNIIDYMQYSPFGAIKEEQLSITMERASRLHRQRKRPRKQVGRSWCQ